MSKTVRVTLTLPRDLWEKAKDAIPTGERSRVVAEALEEQIRYRQRKEAFQRARQLGDEFLEKYGEMPSSVEDIRQMREERDAEITGLR